MLEEPANQSGGTPGSPNQQPGDDQSPQKPATKMQAARSDDQTIDLKQNTLTPTPAKTELHSFDDIARDGKKNDHSHARILSSLLKELSERADHKLPREVFPVAGMHQRYQVSALSKVGSRSRMAFVRAACSIANNASGITRRQRSIYGKIFGHLKPGERIVIGRELLSEAETRREPQAAKQMLASCVASCASLAELHKVVKGLSPHALRKTGNHRLRNMAALVELGDRLTVHKIPGLLRSNAPTTVVNRKLDEIKACLDARWGVMDHSGALKRTRAGKRFMQIIKGNYDLLKTERSRLRGAKARREFANMMIRKLRIEFKHNVHLSCEKDVNGRAAARWTEGDVKALEGVFKLLPDRTTTGANRLAQVKLMEELDGAWGQRDGTGLVKISELVRGEAEYSKQYNYINAMKLVVIHELAHSMKFGKWSDGRSKKESIVEVASESNPDVDFADFIRLSNWDVVSPKRFKVGDGGQSVEIDGKKYALNEPATFNDERVIFRYDEGKQTLYYHKSEADFPIQAYARYNPWEDWTETFTDYAVLPNRLIQFAPWKFVHMEQVFGLHKNNKDVQNLLRKELPELGEGL